MKKKLAVALVCFTVLNILGCSKQPESRNIPSFREKNAQNIQTDTNENQPEEPDSREFEINIDDNTTEWHFDGIMSKSAVPGVRHPHMREITGSYSVEYIHTPYGAERDNTLDFDLALDADNTFTLDVTSSGIHASHYGHYYVRRDEIILFYDEPIEQPAHNVYVADSMYGEILGGDKIMFYENCHTIVLSKTQA